VTLLNPKFANILAARPCELRVRGTTEPCNVGAPALLWS